MPMTPKSQTVPLSFRSIYPNKDLIVHLANFKGTLNIICSKPKSPYPLHPPPYSNWVLSRCSPPQLLAKTNIDPLIQARTSRTIFDTSLSPTPHFQYITKTCPFYLPDTSQIHSTFLPLHLFILTTIISFGPFEQPPN